MENIKRGMLACVFHPGWIHAPYRLLAGTALPDFFDRSLHSIRYNIGFDNLWAGGCESNCYQAKPSQKRPRYAIGRWTGSERSLHGWRVVEKHCCLVLMSGGMQNR